MLKKFFILFLLLIVIGAVASMFSDEDSASKSVTEKPEVGQRKVGASDERQTKRTQAELIPYSVINREEMGSTKLSIDLRVDLVDGRLSNKEELAAISSKLKMRHDRTFISFFLPGMELGAGAFATAHHNPSLEVKINTFFLPEKYQHLLK